MADIIDGVTVRMGGQDYVVAALNMKQFRALRSKILTLGNMSGEMTDEQIDSVIEITHAALTRNYPDMTLDQVEELIDMNNARTVIPAIMGISGLVGKTTAGEAVGNP